MSGHAPSPKRIPQEFVLHGDVRVDDYYWLREKSNPDVLGYLAAENDHTRACTAATRLLESALYDELLGHLQETDTSAPYLRNGYYYYRRIEAGKQYAVHCRREGTLTADEEILLDLNALAADKPFLGLGICRQRRQPGRYDALKERAFDIAFLLDQLGLATSGASPRSTGRLRRRCE